MLATKDQAGRDWRAERKRLRARLDELEATMHAINNGDVDAIVVDGPHGSRIFTLKTSEEPYRILAERMNEGVATLSMDGTVLFCNQRLSEMVRIPVVRLMGSSLISLLRKEDRAGFPHLVRQSLRNNVRTEGWLLREGGAMLPVQLSLSSIPLEGSEQGVCMVATDLSDRKRADEATLRAAAIIDSTYDGIIAKTLDGVITGWNRGAETIYGYSQQEMVGQSVYRLIPLDRASEFTSILESIKHGEAVHHFDTIRLRKGGQQVNVSLSVSPIKDTAGNIVGAWTIARDVTERVRAGEEIRKASLYSRSLIEASLDPLVTISREGKITDVNLATENITGLGRAQLIGSDFCEYFAEPEKARQGYETAFSEGSVQDYPLAVRHSSGQLRDVLYNASVFRNEKGDIDGVFAAARDVTARNRAEQRLQRVNRTLQVLSGCTEALMKATDEIAMLQRVCDTVVDVGGYRMAWVGYAEEDERKTVRPANQAGYDDGYLQGINISWADTERGRGPTGTAVREGKVCVCYDVATDPAFAPWRANAMQRGYRSSIVLPLKTDNEILGVLTIYAAETGAFDDGEQRLLEELANNTTYAILALRAGAQRRQVEAALQESEASFRTLAELAPQLVWMCTPDGSNVYFNQRWVYYTGLTMEESYGSGWNTPFHPEDKQPARDAWSHAVANGDVYRIECRLRASDGTYRWFLIRGVPLCDDSGGIIKWFGTCTDIEDLKRAQEQMHISNEKLEQRVEERTADLLALNKELESFTYAVAHDLRAPLRHIHGFSDILRQDATLALSGDSQHCLDCILQATLRMEKLLEDLLNLSRLGRQSVSRRTIRLNELVQDVVNDLAPEIANRQVEWKIGQLPSAECDYGLMKIVFANLLSNAVKFTRPRDLAVIEVGRQSSNGAPVLFVRDNGAGFEMKYVAKLFGVFQRLHLEKDFEGTGVGLATVQRILQKHGGRIWAEAEVGKGATFYLTFEGLEAVGDQVMTVEETV